MQDNERRLNPQPEQQSVIMVCNGSLVDHETTTDVRSGLAIVPIKPWHGATAGWGAPL